MMELDAIENSKSLRQIKEDFLRSIDFMIMANEAEARKMEAVEPEIQGRSKEEKFTEEQLKDDYPTKEAERMKKALPRTPESKTLPF